MIYFDNAATTFPKPEEVYSFMDKFYRQCGVNVGRGQHKLALQASKLVAETRELLLSLFQAPQKKVVFTSSATEAINIILQGIELKDNYNIYISPFEHNSVTRVLHYLKTKYKLNIIELAVEKSSLNFDFESIRNQFSENKPHVLMTSHASNVCGLVVPINELCSIAKSYNALTIVDMAQTAGLVDVDLSGNEIDFAIFAGHKTLYAPLGIAGFVSSNTPLSPLLYGGTGLESANQFLPETTPEKYEVGSQNILSIAGLNASLKWINSTDIRTINEKEHLNRKKLLSTLSKYENIKIIGKTDNYCVGIVSCLFDSYSPDNIGQVLNQQDVAVRTGLHCAPIAHKFLGTFPAGTVRFSVSYFNEIEDFEKLDTVLAYIAESE